MWNLGALEDRLQCRDEDWGEQNETPVGEGMQQPSRPFCPRSTSVFSPELPGPDPSLQALRSPFPGCAPILIATTTVIGWFSVRPPSSSSFRPPARALRRRQRRSGRALPPSGVTEDSRARALSAPPALSPGQFAERGRE